ncbi:MAG: hypothetical protein GWP91_21380 [Rhodobacterales bacterium]|nr:hypothetical protein [Rhodobacterales bacterium]
MLTIALLFCHANAAEVLPVERVRFYETGVAWFERRGSVSQAATLPIPTSHLDDALKSLVVLDGDVNLGAITFPSAPAGDAARVNAGLSDASHIHYQEALQALLGTHVTLQTGHGPISGTLLDVQGPLLVATSTENPYPKAQLPHFAVTVLGADGTLERTTTEAVRSIQTADVDLTERLAVAAQTLVANRAQRSKGLDLQLHGGGELALGYVAEAPVWRVSYRITDPGAEVARVSGWALIHNNTAEDWSNVQIELANGEPDSFLYPFAAPRYADRELLTPDRPMATVSQLATTTVDEMWQVTRGLTVSGGVGSHGYGMGGGGSASGAGGMGTTGVASAGTIKAIPPIETPSQFIYVVARPVTLPAHHSALVPMLDEPVHTEDVVTFDTQSSTARSAVWVNNTTTRTLPAGVLSVIQQGGLAGEAKLRRLKPTETQMVSFGTERDVTLARHTEQLPDIPKDLRYAHKRLVLDNVQTTSHALTIHNRTQGDKEVWVGMAVTGSGTLDTENRTELDRETGATYVVLAAAPGESVERIEAVNRSSQHWQPEDIAADQYREWAELGLGDVSVLRQVADLRDDLQREEKRSRRMEDELERARTQIDGLRESINATEEGASPLTRQAAAVEQEIRKLSARATEQESTQAQIIASLHRALEGLVPVGEEVAAQRD